MKNNTLFTATKTTVRANAFVPFPTLEMTRKTAPNATPTKTKNGFYKWDFDNAQIAKKMASEWNAAYTTARNAQNPAPVTAPTPAKGKAKTDTITIDGKEYTLQGTANGDGVVLMPVDAPKKAEPRKSTKAPARTKGNAFDFGSIKGETNKDKNKALHAMLVSMGIKDSRTPEYMSVWNARPWAK